MFAKLVAPWAGALLLIAWPVQAQTLNQALEQAWSRHPGAASAVHARTAAQSQAEMANGLTPGPASLSLSTLDDQLGANRGKREWELEVETPLWLPGQRSAAQAQAQAAQTEFEAQQLALRLQLAGDVRDAWWAVAEARSNLALLSGRNQASLALVQDVERRVRAGDLARLDLNLARIEQLSIQSELDGAQATLQQAEQSYLVLTGEAPPAQLPPEPVASTESAAQAHPEVKAAAAGALTAQTKLALAEKSPREAPTLALRVVRDRADFADSYADAIGVKLTIPLSWGARVRQDIDSNRALLAQAEADYQQTLRRTHTAGETGRRALASSQRQLELAQRRAALAQDNLTLVEKSFALGESDLPSLLKARTAHFDAQAQAQHQQIKVHAAVSRFNQSLGVLP